MSAVQVETGRHDIPKASGDYFRRFVTALKQRGTELIVIPVPRSGFTFSGTLDASEIEGSVFAKGNHPDFKKQALDAYQSSIANLASYGVTAADFMSAANTELTRNPKKQLFFLQDGHWRPEGAEVAAKAVATTLAAKLPSLKEQISTKEFKLVPGPVTQRNGFGWDVRVKLDCPNTKWQPLVEPYPTVKAELVSGGDLLSDDEFPVYLAGTSYSADSYKMGLESYLKKALGTDLTNIAINGGEAMSSMLDFYTFNGD
ncbi:alginate O-acetyltransferase AlgX-related protein [Deinococcus fonticola]|uniref:alginate O-acetyltransferase AlgX-related protein n=1 Tax=Deinococcus fonticola TaxID=2528713 RepID=UPI0010755BFC|nr:hypothetical protein [Deinococcus fonticola]